MKIMKYAFSFLFLAVVLAIAGVHTARADQCKVSDPTGTPLNIRVSPNGRILKTIKNGSIVYIEQISYDSKNRPWAQISQNTTKGRKILGWVFREFISCYSVTEIRPTPANSWESFYSKLKNSIKNRNEIVFADLLATKYLRCYYWSFCDFTDNEKSNLTSALIFRELKRNNNQGWSDLERFLRRGILSETTEVSDKAYKSIETRKNSNCEETDLSIDFEFENGRWWITGFDISGCGH